VAAIIHLAIHWSWVVSMTRRTRKELTGQCGCMNSSGSQYEKQDKEK